MTLKQGIYFNLNQTSDWFVDLERVRLANDGNRKDSAAIYKS